MSMSKTRTTTTTTTTTTPVAFTDSDKTLWRCAGPTCSILHLTESGARRCERSGTVVPVPLWTAAAASRVLRISVSKLEAVAGTPRRPYISRFQRDLYDEENLTTARNTVLAERVLES